MSLLFGGAGNHQVNFASGSSMDSLQNYSVFSYIYPTATDLSGGIAAKGVGGSNNRRSLELRDTVTDKAIFAIVDCATTDATAESAAGTMSANVNQAVGLSYDGSSTKTIKLFHGTFPAAPAEVSYAAGQPIAGSGAEGNNDGNDQLAGVFGAGTSGSVAQRMSLLIIWNRAISAAEHQLAAFGWWFPPGAVLHADLGMAGTGSQRDLSGFGNTGTVTGATQAPHVPIAPWRRWCAAAA